MRRLFLLLLSYLLFSSFAMAGEDEDIKITELIAMNSETELLAYATLENTFAKNTIESLQSGIDLSFAYYMELYRTTPEWPDELVTNLEFTHEVSYDTLKDDYVLKFSEKDRQIRLATLTEARERMSHMDDVAVTPLSQLLPNATYKLRLRVIRNASTEPIGVGGILPFMPEMKSKSEWVEYEFIYERQAHETEL